MYKNMNELKYKRMNLSELISKTCLGQKQFDWKLTKEAVSDY